MKNTFNSTFVIYQEQTPDHYIGSDVSVTISSNTKGRATAESIAKLIIDYDNGLLVRTDK